MKKLSVILVIYIVVYLGFRGTNILVHYESIKKCGWTEKKYMHCHRIEFRRIECGMFSCIFLSPVLLIGFAIEILYFPIASIEGAYWQSQEKRSLKY